MLLSRPPTTVLRASWGRRRGRPRKRKAARAKLVPHHYSSICRIRTPSVALDRTQRPDRRTRVPSLVWLPSLTWSRGMILPVPSRPSMPSSSRRASAQAVVVLRTTKRQPLSVLWKS